MTKGRSREAGIAVLLSLFYAILVVGLVLSGGMGFEASERDGVRPDETRQRGFAERIEQLARTAARGALLRIREGRAPDYLIEAPIRSDQCARIQVRGAGPRVLDIRVRILDPRPPATGPGADPIVTQATVRFLANLAELRYRPPAATALCLGPRGEGSQDLLPVSLSPAEVAMSGEGMPEILAVPPGRFDLARLCGLDRDELVSVADFVPGSYEEVTRFEGLCVLRGDRHFDAHRPLRAEGLILVEGDLELSGSGHEIRGVLIVGGELRVPGEVVIRGQVVALGAVQLGAGVDLRFDEAALDDVRRWVCGLRLSGRPQRVAPAGAPEQR